MTATPCITKDRLIDLGNGQVVVKFSTHVPPPTGPLTEGVLSIQPDGSFGWRVSGTTGPWEAGKVIGTKVVWTDQAYPTGEYAVLLV